FAPELARLLARVRVRMDVSWEAAGAGSAGAETHAPGMAQAPRGTSALALIVLCCAAAGGLLLAHPGLDRAYARGPHRAAAWAPGSARSSRCARAERRRTRSPATTWCPKCCAAARLTGQSAGR